MEEKQMGKKSWAGGAAANCADVEFEIPGELVKDEQKARQILRKVRELCGWRMESFPGSQPVSLSRVNLAEIRGKQYVGCEKSDGIRSLLFAAAELVFLIDRKQEVHELEMHLPRKEDRNLKHQVTLLDGELVVDDVLEEVSDDDNNKKKVTKSLRYLIYDAICIQRDVGLKVRNLLHRLNRVAVEVIQPYRKYYFPGQGEIPPSPPLLPLFLKDFFDICDIDAIYGFSNRLPHLSDGIIFTPVKLPYTPGTCHQLLKWKPPHLNTVDFAADMLYDHTGCPRLIQLFVAKNGVREWGGTFAAPYGDQYRKLMEAAVLRTMSVQNLIVECYWVPHEPVRTFTPFAEQTDSRNINPYNDFQATFNFDAGTWVPGGWVIERVRVDKKMPNDQRVVQKVWQSIEDGISFNDLTVLFNRWAHEGRKALADTCQVPKYYLDARKQVANSKKKKIVTTPSTAVKSLPPVQGTTCTTNQVVA